MAHMTIEFIVSKINWIWIFKHTCSWKYIKAKGQKIKLHYSILYSSQITFQKINFLKQSTFTIVHDSYRELFVSSEGLDERKYK